MAKKITLSQEELHPEIVWNCEFPFFPLLRQSTGGLLFSLVEFLRKGIETNSEFCLFGPPWIRSESWKIAYNHPTAINPTKNMCFLNGINTLRIGFYGCCSLPTKANKWAPAIYDWLHLGLPKPLSWDSGLGKKRTEMDWLCEFSSCWGPRFRVCWATSSDGSLGFNRIPSEKKSGTGYWCCFLHVFCYFNLSHFEKCGPGPSPWRFQYACNVFVSWPGHLIYQSSICCFFWFVVFSGCNEQWWVNKFSDDFKVLHFGRQRQQEVFFAAKAQALTFTLQNLHHGTPAKPSHGWGFHSTMPVIYRAIRPLEIRPLEAKGNSVSPNLGPWLICHLEL